MIKNECNIKRFLSIICITMILFSNSVNIAWAAEEPKEFNKEINNSNDVQPLAFVGEKSITIPSLETRVVY